MLLVVRKYYYRFYSPPSYGMKPVLGDYGEEMFVKRRNALGVLFSPTMKRLLQL